MCRASIAFGNCLCRADLDEALACMQMMNYPMEAIVNESLKREKQNPTSNENDSFISH